MRIKSQMPIGVTAGAKTCRKCGVLCCFPHRIDGYTTVVSAAKEARDARDCEDPFFEIWVVFDTEGIQNTVRQQSARRAISQASNLGFRHAVSNPSFEYWLLLHFEYCVKTFPNGAAVETALKKYIPTYGKGMNCFHIVRKHTPTAIKNAVKNHEDRCRHIGPHPCDCHPSTQIHLLIERIQSF